jgi:hypothetical protein
MLLLLLKSLLPELENAIKTIRLDDLFQIQTGLLEGPSIDYYTDEQFDKKSQLRILRMGSFNPVTRKLKSKKELDDADKRLNEFRIYREKDKKSRTKILAKEKRVVAPNKILDEDDYVINTRSVGEMPITGYSIRKSSEEGDFKSLGQVSISHHFIVLKPRKSSLPLFVPFLHLMLDVLVDKQLRKIAEDKGFLRSKELRDLQFSIPINYEDQKKVFEKYAALQMKVDEANRTVDNFKNELSQLVELRNDNQ